MDTSVQSTINNRTTMGTINVPTTKSKTIRTISVVLSKEIKRSVLNAVNFVYIRQELRRQSKHKPFDKEYRLFVTAIAQHAGHNTEDFLL